MISLKEFILFSSVFLSVYFEYVLKENSRMGGIFKWEIVNEGHVNNIYIVLDSINTTNFCSIQVIVSIDRSARNLNEGKIWSKWSKSMLRKLKEHDYFTWSKHNFNRKVKGRQYWNRLIWFFIWKLAFLLESGKFKWGKGWKQFCGEFLLGNWLVFLVLKTSSFKWGVVKS